MSKKRTSLLQKALEKTPKKRLKKLGIRIAYLKDDINLDGNNHKVIISDEMI